MSSLIRALAACLLALLAGLPAAFAQPADEYELGPGDSVRVSVYLNPELAAESRISESGQIAFPLLGPVRVGGLTAQRAADLIAGRLKTEGLVQNAQVIVSVLQYRSQQVSVLGSVNRPGRYAIESPGTRLTEVLAIAGGVGAGGADTVILTRRGADGRLERREIDLPAIYLDGRGEQDVVMRGGDSLYVHRQPIFYVYGQVQKPGHYPLERGMTVGQAIATGGSFTLRSRESGVRLLRRDDTGRTVESTPRLDDAVRADDQIFVRESLF